MSTTTSSSPSLQPPSTTTKITTVTAPTATTEHQLLASSTKNITRTATIIDNKNPLQIFLGGSCNPTTWRKNVAIPYLETNCITYYNPQIDNWTPEVVNLERYAKQNAQVLLFVIDTQTRSTVSIVESAFMAGEKKNLVLVIYPFNNSVVSKSVDFNSDEPGDTRTTMQTVSNIETRSQRRTKTSLAINHRSNQPSSFLRSSSSISSASKTTSTLISTTTNRSNSTTTLSSSACNKTCSASSELICGASCTTRNLNDPSNNTSLEGNALYREHHQEAVLEASETFKMSGEFISLSEFQELKRARYLLKNLTSLQEIPIFSDIRQALEYITRNLKSGFSLENSQSTVATIKGPDLILGSSRDITSREILESEDETINDVYLSLDSDDHSSIELSVQPILDEKGLTYYCMYMDSIIKCDKFLDHRPPNESSSSQLDIDLPNLPSNRFKLRKSSPSIDVCKSLVDESYQIPASSKLGSTSPSPVSSVDSNMYELISSALKKEICVIQKSRVLLFVITNKCRGLSIMVLASHFMALFRSNVVLCLQYLEEPCSINGEILTQTAIADYNRGRVYLNDYAIKSQVPVFSTIHEAIEYCSRKLRCNGDSDSNNKSSIIH